MLYFLDHLDQSKIKSRLCKVIKFPGVCDCLVPLFGDCDCCIVGLCDLVWYINVDRGGRNIEPPLKVKAVSSRGGKV